MSTDIKQRVKAGVLITLIVIALTLAGGIIMAQADHGHRLNTHERDIEHNVRDIGDLRRALDTDVRALHREVGAVREDVRYMRGLMERNQ